MSHPSVTVTGAGAAAAPPDLMVVVVGVECVARHTAEALEQAATAITAMRDVAVSAGVAPVDLSTSSSQLWPDHDRDGRPNGYRAQLALTVRVRDLEAAPDLLPALIGAGGDVARLHSTALAHSDPAVLAALARGAAFADARARAEQYAALAGLELGAVVAVAEPDQPGHGVFRRSAVGGAQALAASVQVPVEAGTAEVTASVTVRWRLV